MQYTQKQCREVSVLLLTVKANLGYFDCGQCCELFSVEDLSAPCEKGIPQQTAEDTQEICTRIWIPCEAAILVVY